MFFTQVVPSAQSPAITNAAPARRSRAVTVAPYELYPMGELVYTELSVILLFTVGILHTGLTYTVYFGAIPKLKAATVAILSYIDPSSAVLLSAIILREKISLTELVGAVLIIGAAAVSEIQFKNLDNENTI